MTNETDNLATIWDEIKDEVGVSPEEISTARTQILAQPEPSRDEYAFQQAYVHARLGVLASVIAWIDAENKLPEEKLQRAKYLVDQVRIVESHQAAQSTDPSRLLERITDVLSQLAQEHKQ